MLLSLPPSTQSSPLPSSQGSSTWPYLGHLDWCCQSQLASPASVLPGMSSHNAAMTPVCPREPRTGHSQSGESYPENSAPRGAQPHSPCLHGRIQLATGVPGRRWTCQLWEKCGHQLESRTQMIVGEPEIDWAMASHPQEILL